MSYLIRNSKHAIPSEYVEVEYIQSSGTQYIDTGHKPNQDSSFEIDAQMISKGSFFACRWSQLPTYDTYGIGYGSASYIYAPIHYGKYNLGENKGYVLVPSSKISIFGRHKIEMVKNKLSIDGGVYSFTFPNNTFQALNSLYIFGNNNSASTGYTSAKVYSCKLWDDDNLVHDYIPVKVKTTNEYGMYDLVSKQFFGNDGTGSFTGGEEVINTKTYNIQNTGSLVPSEYEEVEYIQSTNGAQYIKTGFMPNNKTSAETIITPESGTPPIAAARWSQSPVYDTWGFYSTRLTGSIVRTFYFYYGRYSEGKTWNANENYTYGHKYRFSFSPNKIEVFDITDNIVHKTDNIVSDTYQSPREIYLLGFNNNGSSLTQSGVLKMHEFKLYDDGVLVRHYIPVKVKATNEYGMYDLVSKQFFSNNGTGSFTGGPVVKRDFTYTIQNNSYVKSHLLNNFYISTLDRKVPSEYDEVEYLETTLSSTSPSTSTTKYIDLGFVADENTGIITDVISNTTIQDTPVFGGNNSEAATSNAANFHVTLYKNTWRLGTNGSGEANSNIRSDSTADAEYHIEYNVDKSIFKVNSSSYTMSKTPTGNGNLCIAFRRGKVSYRQGSWKYKTFKVINNSTKETTMRLIPVKKKSNNEYGMYDLVSKQFFGNSGTGSFTGGNVIQPKLKSFLIKGGN